MMKFKINKSNILPIIGFPLLFIAIFAVLIIFWKPIFEVFKNQEQMKAWISSYGIMAPIIFIGLQIIQVVIFVIPGEVPQIAGGYLFGTWQGILYSIIGIALGSMINFILARLLGIPFVKSILKNEQLEKIQELANSPRSQAIIFLIYLIPGLPVKDILSFVAGLSPMKLYVFLIISMLGRLPGIIGSAVMGEAASDKNWILLIVVSVIAILLFLVGFIFKDKIFNLLKHKADK